LEPSKLVSEGVSEAMNCTVFKESQCSKSLLFLIRKRINGMKFLPMKRVKLKVSQLLVRLCNLTPPVVTDARCAGAIKKGAF
jgi:hypothetical protein